MKKLNYFLAVPMIIGAGVLSACADNPPPQTTTTTSETVQGAAPAPMVTPAPMQPGMPGTVTTQTTHSESVPAQ
jgi:hypothetical protein